MARGVQGEARSSGRRIAAWTATAASPLILYLIVKAVAGGVSPAASIALAALPPADPTPNLKFLGRTSQQPNFRADDSHLRSAQQGLAALPLAFEPFFIAARVAEQRGDLRRAIALMEEARRRRPSYPAVRMQLMIYYTKAERFREAMTEVDVILRRNNELRPVMLPELTKLIADPHGRDALATILATEPSWREDFFNVAATRKINPVHARALYERVRALKRGGDVRLERQFILQAQASSGDYAGARQTLLAALPERERAANRFLFDGAFRGAPAAPKPFGWKFEDLDVGRAEPSKNGGRAYLDVAYFGGRAETLAEQVLALRPGRYTIRAIARSDNGVSSGSLAWNVSCLPSRSPVVGTLDLSQAVATERRFAATVTVPATGCASQSLRLRAEPGDVAASINLEVSALEITQ
ncbi:MAG TPA: tetratricopeptide repeat protein [Allosphingosinicella sp.]